MLTRRSKSGRLVRTSTLPSRSAQEARVAARSASASATDARAAAASASARLGAWPNTMAIFASPPGGSEISPQKAATRRPSSRAAPSAEPVSTIAGVWMSRPGPPKKRARTVSVAGRVQAGRGEGEAALEIVARVLKDERRADRLVADLADALVRAFLEREIEERNDAQALRPRAVVAQRQHAGRRTAGPAERTTTYSSVRSPRRLDGTSRRPARRRPRRSRPRAGTARSRARRSRPVSRSRT